MSNLFIGDYAGARYDYNRAKNVEKTCNNLSTVAGLTIAGASAYGVKKLVDVNPKTAKKVYLATDEYVRKGATRAAEYGNKALEWANKNTKVKSLTDKLSGWIGKAVDKFTKSDIGKNIVKKFNKFMKKSPANRGKYMLLAAGVTALAATVINIVRNHDRKDGAIEQKYNDISTLSRII